MHSLVSGLMTSIPTNQQQQMSLHMLKCFKRPIRPQVRSGIKSVPDIWQGGVARLYQQIKKYNATLSTNRAETEKVIEAETALIDLGEELDTFYESDMLMKTKM